MMDVSFVKQRQQHVDVQKRHRHQRSSSIQRLTSAVVITGEPGCRWMIGTPLRTLYFRGGQSALRANSDRIWPAVFLRISASSFAACSTSSSMSRVVLMYRIIKHHASDVHPRKA